MHYSREGSTSDLGPARSIVMALIAIVATTLLLHKQLAAALVVRGDELLYQSDVPAALRFYARARVLDPDSAIAIDRYAFLSMISHRRTLLENAVRQLSVFVRRHGLNAALIFDRALCERLLRDDRSAEEDFVAVGVTNRDPRALVFAGYVALQRGALKRARLWWRVALWEKSGYIPALRALERR